MLPFSSQRWLDCKFIGLWIKLSLYKGFLWLYRKKSRLMDHASLCLCVSWATCYICLHFTMITSSHCTTSRLHFRDCSSSRANSFREQQRPRPVAISAPSSEFLICYIASCSDDDCRRLLSTFSQFLYWQTEAHQRHDSSKVDVLCGNCLRHWSAARLCQSRVSCTEDARQVVATRRPQHL